MIILSAGLLVFLTAAPAVELPDKNSPLTRDESGRIEKEAQAYFEADPSKQVGWDFGSRFQHAVENHEQEVRRAVWKAYRHASSHAPTWRDFLASQVRHGKLLSPYVVKKVGTRPENGWPLFIALHGGGNAPKRVNDSQWKIMQRYYRDQPGVTGYLYLALRAPNDEWNGFYADYVTPLLAALIRQQLLFADVDPDKVFLMGYSHGGYGAFFLGPKLADHFAAVHASASAPTDNTVSPRTLRNTRFTFMIGEKDTMYGRLDRCTAFAATVDKLKKENPGDFPVQMELMKGHGHGGLPDRDKIKEMYPHRRDPVPRRLSWDLTDGVIDRFFWLGAPKPGPGRSIDATIAGNVVTVTTRGVVQLELSLDGRLVDVRKPLRVVIDGAEHAVVLRPSLATLCRSMNERGDPALACTCRVTLEVPKR